MFMNEDDERKTAKQLLDETFPLLEQVKDQANVYERKFIVDQVVLKIEQATSKIQAACCDAEAQLNKMR